MCGILGCMGLNIPSEKFRTATNLLAHRGPDNTGYYSSPDGSVHLGHTRLSILDLSGEAHQPFVSKSGDHIIVYNGEIYNYPSLKDEFRDKYSFDFKTSSDTELIVESFEREGPDFILRCNGMFAMAIYNVKSAELYLFRDRMGIKPLYYHKTDSAIAFGSELKSLRSIVKDKSINKGSVSDFLHLGFIPEPSTIYNEIKKFPSGHYGKIGDNEFELTSYWSPNPLFEAKPKNIKDPVSSLEEILIDSVSSRLLSDVPVGAFLSGGIDSSLITAIASKHHDLALPTFHISFENSNYDESKYAKKIADHLGTRHYERELKEREAIELVSLLPDLFDEPFADSSAIPMLLISQLASKEVKVCLSGDGGDELFMGYGMYDWAKRLSNPLIRSFKKPIKSALSMSSSERNKRASWLFENDYGNTMSHIFSQEQYLFSREELELKFNWDFPERGAGYHNQKRSAAENQSFYDLTNYLKDDLLVKVDRSSMHHSLEVRVPLLDHRLVEFSLSLEEKYKKRKGQSKILLSEVLYRYLPEEFFQRPKWGFSVPLNKWLRSDLKYLPDTYLEDSWVRELGLVDPAYVEELKNAFFIRGEDRWYNRIWALTIIHKWFKEE